MVLGTLLAPLNPSLYVRGQPPDLEQDDFARTAISEDWTSASELTPGVNYTTILSLRHVVDWWKVFLNATQHLTVELVLTYWIEPRTSGYYDFDLFLYDTHLTELDYSVSSTAHESVTAVTTTSGWFYIKVEQHIGIGPYTITSVVREDGKSDEHWWGATYINRTSINGTTINGSIFSGELNISTDDAIDWFSLKLFTTEILWVNVTFYSLQLDLFIRLYDENLNMLAVSTGYIDIESVNAVAYLSGLYFLEIVSFQGAGTYTTSIMITGNGELDNYWWAIPTPIKTGNNTGSLSPTAADPSDWFIVQLRTAEVLYIDLMFLNTQIDIDARIYDSDLHKLDESTGYRGRENVSAVASASGIYYLELLGFWGTGNYSFIMEVISPISIIPGLYHDDLNATSDPTQRWYSFILGSEKAANIRIEFPSSQINIDIHLYSFNMRLQWIDGSYGHSNTEEVTAISSGPSNWYILVEVRWGFGNYSLTLDVNSIISIESGTFAGFLNETNTEDWFRVDLQSDNFTKVHLRSNGTDFDLDLFSSEGLWVGGSYLGLSISDKVLGVAPFKKYYYIRVFRTVGKGFYQLEVTISKIIPISSATHSDILNESIPDRLYAIELQQGDRIIAQTTSAPELNVNLAFLNPEGKWIVGSCAQRGMSDEIVWVVSVPGIYFLHVALQYGRGQYFLSHIITPNYQPPTDLAGNSLQSARKIIAGRYNEVLDELSDPHDYYSIQLEAGDSLIVTINDWDQTADFELEILDPKLLLIEGSWDTTPEEMVVVSANSSGTYYIHVYSVQGNSSYALVTKIKPGISPVLDFAGNDALTARSILTGAYEDYLSDTYDPDDYYRIQMEEGDNVTISISGWNTTIADFEIQVLNSSLAILTTASGISAKEEINYIAEYSGVFYIHVYSISGNGWYALMYKIVGLEPPKNSTTRPDLTTVITHEIQTFDFQVVGTIFILCILLWNWKSRRKKDK